MDKEKLEKYEKYGLSIGFLLMFGTIAVFNTINHLLYSWDLFFAYIMLLPMLFCGFMSEWWLKKIKEDI